MNRFVLVLLTLAGNSHGFTSLPCSQTTSSLSMVGDLLESQEQIDETEMIRAQIEDMRQEAIERLHNLNKQVEDYRTPHDESSVVAEPLTMSSVENIEMVKTSTGKPHVEVHTEQPREQLELKPQNERDALDLLHDTTWKLVVNIGREPGTWMPKTWGESGDRLLLNLAIEFTDEELGDREEFLNGVGGTKALKVVASELTVGPSLTEGSRTLKVKNGGWRVATEEGAAGTDLLRFYFEIDEVAQHKGRDVYCPKGRIYCTCGYFPLTERRGSTKDDIRHQQEALQRKYDRLSVEDAEDENTFSLTKMARAKELFDIRMEAKELNLKMHHARIREPEKELLRVSKDGGVGLTREGGVCCKVRKGMAIEYHILGRFGVASIENKKSDVQVAEAPKLRP